MSMQSHASSHKHTIANAHKHTYTQSRFNKCKSVLAFVTRGGVFARTIHRVYNYRGAVLRREGQPVLVASQVGSEERRTQRCLQCHDAWLPDLEDICSSAPAATEWALRMRR